MNPVDGNCWIQHLKKQKSSFWKKSVNKEFFILFVTIPHEKRTKYDHVKRVQLRKSYKIKKRHFLWEVYTFISFFLFATADSFYQWNNHKNSNLHFQIVFSSPHSIWLLFCVGWFSTHIVKRDNKQTCEKVNNLKSFFEVHSKWRYFCWIVKLSTFSFKSSNVFCCHLIFVGLTW